MTPLLGKSLQSRIDFGNGDVVTIETLRLSSDVDTIARHREQIAEICEQRGVMPHYPDDIGADRLN